MAAQAIQEDALIEPYEFSEPIEYVISLQSNQILMANSKIGAGKLASEDSERFIVLAFTGGEAAQPEIAAYAVSKG